MDIQDIDIDKLVSDNEELRIMLALRYCGDGLITSNGNLLDTNMVPHIDFRHDEIEVIQQKMRVRHQIQSEGK